MSRVATTSVLVLGVLLLAVTPAWGSNEGTAGSNGNGGYDVHAKSESGDPGQSSAPSAGHTVSRGTGRPTTCTANGVTGPITAVALSDQQVEDAFTHHASFFTGHAEPGTYYKVYCGGQYLNIEWVPDGTPAPGQGGPIPAPVDPRAIAQDAIDHVTLPTPVIHLNPAGDQLVNLATWLWIDPGAMQVPPVSVDAGPVTVTATATAVRVRWDMGNGEVVTCNGPGTPWTPGHTGSSPDCGYTYTHSSAAQPDEAYKVTATVEWAAAYTVTGAPGGGPLPGLQRSASRPIRVAEAQAVNTR